MKPSNGEGGKRKRKGNGNKGPAAPKVAEATRIHIANILRDFRASDKNGYTFEEELSKSDRAAVHMLCRKMGMVSKSCGRGAQRRVSVFKREKKGEDLKGSESFSLFLSEDSKEVLLDLFVQYPPGLDELGQLKSNDRGKEKKNSKGRRDDIFCKPLMNKVEVTKKMEVLSSRLKNDPNLAEINETRSRLPIASARDAILSEIQGHQVVLISGETGSGKTTQVPQYILDKMWEAGEACKIICTQPRRISAISVAERVSQERGENIGETVGYKIRLESKGGRQSSLVFCTNGIMLRVLVSDGTSVEVAESNLSEITHIIVDEIHERDHYSDFMLAILRDLLPKYPHLRLVLMSATMDAERFSQYFGGCPVIRVPGFTYPVEAFYLEDVLCMLKSTKKARVDAAALSDSIEQHELTDEHKAALNEAIDSALSNDELDSLLELISSEGTSKALNYQHSLSGVSPLMVFAAKGRVGDICMLLSLGADCHLEAKDGSTALEFAKRGEQTEAAEILTKHSESASSDSREAEDLVDKYMSNVNPEHVDVVLIGQLLRKICTDSDQGAILVFLPGWDDINKTKDSLLANQFFNNSKFLILSMHSMVPPAEQRKVFKRPPPGCRKIILSTNITETAVTIDDVVYVIDSGRLKEKSYDPYSNVSTLQSSWVSKASARQREGRAGRCQPGICYHLYSKLRADSLLDFQVPEIRRMPIEELCLQVKMLDPKCSIEGFLKKTLDPPVFESIKNGIAVLEEIGALSKDETLTELGKKLGSLPVHPLTSKMIFFGILLNCLDPALTLACASNYRDPFLLPMLPHEKKKAADAKAELAALYGGNSEQLAVVAAFDCWRNARQKGQDGRFCSQYFVSSGTMNMLFGMRKQLERELSVNGYIPDDASTCSLNARDPGIIRAVLVAGLYPRVGRVHPRNNNKFVVETASGDKVRVHPQSTYPLMALKNPDDNALVVYDEIMRGDAGLTMRKCTVVGTIPLLLLAGEIAVAPTKGSSDYGGENDSGSGSEDNDDDEEEMKMEKADENPEGKIMSSADNSVTMIVDRWLSFECTALEVAQIYCLRERLFAAILMKATNPRKLLPPELGASIYAIACILSYDGFSGIPPALQSVDNLTSMMGSTGIGMSKQGKRGNPHIHTPSGFLKSLFYPTAAHHHTPSARNNRNPAPQRTYRI